jgi:hypothetical protein
MGMPVHEGQTATALIKGAEIYAELRKLGLPVKSVFCPPFGSRSYVRRFDGNTLCQFRPARRPRGLGYQAGAVYLLYRDCRAGCGPDEHERGRARDYDQMPSGQRHPPRTAYSRVSRVATLSATEGTAYRRRCRGNLRLHLAEGLAARKYSGKGQF